MGEVFSKDLTAEEKAAMDLKVPNSLKIEDKHKEFKMKFPLYMMDIEAFGLQLNDACAEHNFWNSDSITTYVCTKNDLLDELCELQTFKRARDRFEKLLDHEFFRETLRENEEKCSTLTEPQFNNLLCKLDLGVLALCWCKGDKDDKAKVLFDFCKVPPRQSPEGWSDLQPSEYGTSSRRRQKDIKEALKISISQSFSKSLSGLSSLRRATTTPKSDHVGFTDEVSDIDDESKAPQKGIEKGHFSGRKIKRQIDPDKEALIWTNKNLAYVFKRMFMFSIDFPVAAWDLFKEYELWNHSSYSKTWRMRRVLNARHKEFFDFHQWTHKVEYSSLYEPWLISILYEDSSKLSRPDFVSQFQNNKKLAWFLSGLKMRSKYKKFQIQYNRNEKERIAHELNQSHSHISESIIYVPLRERIDDWLWYNDHEIWNEQQSLSLSNPLIELISQIMGKNLEGMLEKLPVFQRVLRFCYALLIALTFADDFQVKDLKQYLHLNYIVLVITCFIYLLGSYAAQDMSDLHIPPKKIQDQGTDGEDSALDFQETCEGCDQKYYMTHPWKWFIILYQFCFLTTMSITTIMLTRHILFPDVNIIWPGFKESDAVQHFVVFFILIFDHIFNCVPFTWRHYIFTVLLQLTFCHFNMLMPNLYKLPNFSLLVMAFSFVFQIIFHKLSLFKLKFLGFPYDRILRHFHKSKNIDEQNKLIMTNGMIQLEAIK